MDSRNYIFKITVSIINSNTLLIRPDIFDIFAIIININYRVLIEDVYLKLGECNLRQNMLQRTFRQFRVFVFDLILNNENAEAAESFLQHILSQVRLL